MVTKTYAKRKRRTNTEMTDEIEHVRSEGDRQPLTRITDKRGKDKKLNE